MAEFKPKKPTVDFNKILEQQKKDESDPKFAISDALQEFKDTVEKQSGYQSETNLQNLGIRSDVINFVDNYSITDLDTLKGMDFDEALDMQKKTEKEINEFTKLKVGGESVLTQAEIDYIKNTVGLTNQKLKEVLGVSTRLTLAFRDFKKELKPLKLAKRIGLTNIPIIGRKIQRAIDSEDAAERSALSIKRTLRKKEAKLEKRDQQETAARGIMNQTLGGGKTPGLDKETAVEEERESDQQFDTTSGLLQNIYEESKITNELLSDGAEKKKGDKDGFSILEVLGMKKLYDFVKAGKVATLVKNLGALSRVAGVFGLALAAGYGIAKLFEKIALSNVGPEERKVIQENSQFGIMDETNLDVDEAFERQRDAQLLDEYNRGVEQKVLNPNEMTFEDYKQAKADAGIKRELKYEGFMGTPLFDESNKAQANADYLAIRAQHSENQVDKMIVPPSMKSNIDDKIATASSIMADGVEKGANVINNSQNSGNTNIINNNQQNNDNSNNVQNLPSGSVGLSNMDTITNLHATNIP